MSAPFVPRSLECTCHDARLAQAVTTSVRSRCGNGIVEFSAVVHQGIATLHGQVRGYYKKQILLAATQAVPGIEQVIDRIVVLPLTWELCSQDSDEFDACSMA